MWKIIELLKNINRNLNTIAVNQAVIYCKLASIEEKIDGMSTKK